MITSHNKPIRLMFVAGENSADQHASRLILELKKQIANLQCFGYGGSQMAAAGMRLDFNLAEGLPIIGITQAIKHYPELKRLFNRARRMLAHERPDALVLVDYPGFNLRLAREATKLHIPVIYYIAPQVWAWHSSRIKILAKTVSMLLVIFPFEETLFRQAGIETYYVGHPLLDAPLASRSRQEVLDFLGLPVETTLIGLIPGSRRSELKYHLRPMLEAARRVAREIPQAAFVLPQAHTITSDLLRPELEAYRDLRIRIVEDDHASVRTALDFAICKSGTSTLELALAGVPMVVIYRVSTPTYLIARAVVRTQWISLVNIVMGRAVVPELLQDAAAPDRIAEETLKLLRTPTALAEMRTELSRIKGMFGPPGCAKRAAERIVAFLNNCGEQQRCSS
ncbi:MAG: lipid-A-disaccharide synthase [Candidatus Sumerlaeaceae bacterium]|nr:lipid-A-disaccharide synthase [Candidatus Sumerlaeaceae bacterium]